MNDNFKFDTKYIQINNKNVNNNNTSHIENFNVSNNLSQKLNFDSYLNNNTEILELSFEPKKYDKLDVSEKEDISQKLISMGDKYQLRDSFQGEPTNIGILQNEVDEVNSLFRTGIKNPINGFIRYKDLDGSYKTVEDSFLSEYFAFKSFAEVGHVPLLHLRDAAKAEDRYFSKSGQTFTEADLEENLIESGYIKYHLENVINDYINLSYDLVPNGKSIVVENKNFLIGSDGNKVGKSNVDFDLQAFIHNSSANAIGEITNNDGVYTLKLRYFIEDIYDWKSGYNDNLAGKVESMYFNQLLLGNAKSFLVHIEQDIEVTFEIGKEPIVKYYKTPIYKY